MRKTTDQALGAQSKNAFVHRRTAENCVACDVALRMHHWQMGYTRRDELLCGNCQDIHPPAAKRSRMIYIRDRG